MKDWLIRQLAWFVSIPAVANYLIERAQRTPYEHLPGYMDRWWLFNAYVPGSDKQTFWHNWFPSIRIHHIKRADLARHPHDHPWNARTIVLRGHYYERRMIDGHLVPFFRGTGDTATLQYGEYHKIVQVSDGGVWTMFMTAPYQGTWGFLVDGKKVPHREYRGVN